MFIIQLFSFLCCVGIVTCSVDVNMDGTTSSKPITVHNHYMDEINVMLLSDNDSDWIMNVAGKFQDVFYGEVGQRISCPRVFDEELTDVFSFVIEEDTTEVHVGGATPKNVEKVSGTLSNSNGVTLEVTNTLEYDVSVMWYDANNIVKIADVSADSTANMNTFVGHQFFVMEKGDPTQFRLMTFEIERGVDRIDLVDDSSSRDMDRLIDEELEMTAPPLVQPVKSAQSTKLHPQVKLLNQRSTSVGAKFKSLHPTALRIWYEDGRDGIEQGLLGAGKETTTNTYEGHVFYFTEPENQHKEIARVLITKDQPIYIIREEGVADEELKKKLPNGVFDLAMKEQAFCEAYKKKNGFDWKHYYGPSGPRAPPTLYMHPADYVGQQITRISDEGHWHCTGPAKDCQSNEPVNMTLEVISQFPRAYVADVFLSDVETDAIIAYAKERVAASTVGQDEGGGVRSSDTRTSRNTWIDRSASPIFESLFKRAAHLINVDEKLLTERNNAERLQVVNYVNGQKYDAHHDWGVSGYPESRFLTLLLYLTDQVDENAGGETAFPKAADGKGIKIIPKKGTAALFYSLLPDGNGDDLSLHASLPTWKGEKWLANFWVWDPKRK